MTTIAEYRETISSGVHKWINRLFKDNKIQNTATLEVNAEDLSSPGVPAVRCLWISNDNRACLEVREHGTALPIVALPCRMQFIVLGGICQVTFYEAERYPAVVAQTADATVAETARKHVSNRARYEFRDTYDVVEVRENTFFAIDSLSENVLLLVVFGEAVPHKNATYYWTKDPACVHRGIPAYTKSGQLTRDSLSALRERLLVLCGPKADAHQRMMTNLDAVVGGVACLKATVEARSPPVLREDDEQACKRIADGLVAFVALGGSLPVLSDRLTSLGGGGLKVTQDCNRLRDGGVQVAINRFTIFDDDKVLALKVHMFADATETFRHNHTTAVISVALRGGYTHSHFQIEPHAETLNLSKRGADGRIVPDPYSRITGRLVLKTEYAFTEGNSYFLNKKAFHTVRSTPARTEAELATSVVTLFFKDRYKAPNAQAEFADVPEDVDAEERKAEEPDRLLDLLHRRLRVSLSPPSELMVNRQALADRVAKCLAFLSPQSPTSNPLGFAEFTERTLTGGNSEAFARIQQKLATSLPDIPSDQIVYLSKPCDTLVLAVAACALPSGWQPLQDLAEVCTASGPNITVVRFTCESKRVEMHFDGNTPASYYFAAREGATMLSATSENKVFRWLWALSIPCFEVVYVHINVLRAAAAGATDLESALVACANIPGTDWRDRGLPTAESLENARAWAIGARRALFS